MKKKKPNKNQILKAVMLILSFGFILLAAIEAKGQPLYNTTNLTNADNIYDQTVALNEIVGNNLVGIGLYMVAVIITFTIVSGNTGDSLTGMGAATFIGALSATMLLPLKLISFSLYQLSLLLAGVSVLMSMLLRR